MKIILKKADFSTISIGKSVILDDIVAKYVAKTGTSHSSAINTFVMSLKESNLYDLFEKIYIPCNGSSSYANAFINLKTGNNEIVTEADDNFIVANKGCNIENLTSEIKIAEDYNSTNMHIVLGLTDSISDNADYPDDKLGAFVWLGNNEYYKGITLMSNTYKNLTFACSNNYSELINAIKGRSLSFKIQKPQICQSWRDNENTINWCDLNNTIDKYELPTSVANVNGNIYIGSRKKIHNNVDMYPLGVNITLGLIMLAKNPITNSESVINLQTICKNLLDSILNS